jgi:hypothetical protein
MGEKIDRHEIQGQVLVADVIPPIVIYGDGLCEVYPTIAVACQAVEAIDVKDGLYGAFESTGSPLLLVTHGNLVSIELPLDSTPDPAALERRLSDYIQEVGTDRVGVANLDDASLPVMLDVLLSFQHRAARKWSLRDMLRRIRPSDPNG